MSAGWTHTKRVATEKAFYRFLSRCYINSKDAGRVCLGENLYDAQTRAITAIFDGLERGIHKFYFLKSRQLGISTIIRAFCVFYLGLHDGLQGAVVFDTDGNKQNARREIETIIKDLPAEIEFPRIKGNNRNGITLMQDSTLLFMSAGIRASKSSGTLGRSVGLSLAHLSEICSFENDEGLESFEQSLSEVNPDRLYIYESTARGFNRWHEMWTEAREDDTHCLCTFLGWWSKPSQRIDRSDPDFSRYGAQPPTEKEMKKIAQVRDLYEFNIAPEQLAWVRRKMDPGAKAEGDAPAEYEGSVTRLQEQPWTEEDAFQMTGSVFFAPEKLTAQANDYVSKKFQTYMFSCGIEFTEMRAYPAANSRTIELKVWEEPEMDCVYVVAADVAFGSDEKNDRSAIQVLRCYADGCDQVAEYAWPLINTRQFAWVILALAGWYAGDSAECYLIIELNGPGAAVWDEIVHLRAHIASGYQPKQMQEQGLRDIFRNVRQFVYGRPDSMTPGRSWQWKTTLGSGPSSKIRLMERLRDFTENGQLHIRSQDTLEEMKSVTREGDTIEAKGRKKDDRVMALAMGMRCFEDRVRRMMSAGKRTREFEKSKRRLSVVDMANLYRTHQLEQFFARKRVARVSAARVERRSSWRTR